jgi:NADH-quinone oxidoreductase subunit L
MMSASAMIMSMLAASAGHGPAPVSAASLNGAAWAGWILWLPALSAVLCGLCAALRVKSKAPAWITVGLLGASFLLTFMLFRGYDGRTIIHLFDWFNLHWESGGEARSFVANFSLYIDKLTLLWMLFVTGLGTLIALYASEYMAADVGRGYARFFAGVSLFLFAMSSLVMGDNLVMLYLGWEGVGLASYLLIGYYYQKPSAVEAAKKAFIMNRIGDLGLALAIWLIWHHFGTVEYAALFDQVAGASGEEFAGGWQIRAIPFLLMLGAFGKSAQGPLFVWLPDAMEGPTPVSALIHAATMVTAGVYLLARMFPVMGLHELALPTVAWVGGLTALVSATIGMAQYDIKRIMAYSTVSQLGYMFVGIGALTTYGAAFHVFTHAFFKAVLFLTCGAVMHGFAGQLDLRKISGLRRMPGWKIVAWTMFIGCLCLAGFPETSGYFSKDVILAECFARAEHGLPALGWILLFTAGLTAYYTFRVWFRVCAGPPSFVMGEEHHGAVDHGAAHEHGHGHGHGRGAAHGHEAHHDQPHPPGAAINFVLVVIAIGALLAAIPALTPMIAPDSGNWVQQMIIDSSAAAGAGDHHHEVGESQDHAAHGTFLGFDPHRAMYFASAIVGLIGIAIAWRLHLSNRAGADALKAALHRNGVTRMIARAMENKWYIDELYDATVRGPLWLLGHALSLLDRWVLDFLIIARLPRGLGRSFQPLQNGVLQSYAVSMAGGAGLIIVLVAFMPEIRQWLGAWMGGGG